jgi:tripartite-type tricarboxylate transporter receptor subunit TctC
MKTAKNSIGILALTLVLSAAFLAVTWDVSRAAWPERPIRMILSNSPGGGADLSWRALCKRVEKRLGQPIMVENKVGAGGTLGVGLVAKTKPDGYTFGETTLIPMALGPNMFNVPYDPHSDFEFIVVIGQFMFGFVVRNDSPFKTFQEVVRYAKMNPGKYKVGLYTLASGHWLALNYVADQEGIKWGGPVVFAGGAKTMMGLLGGHVDGIGTVVSVAGTHITAGKARLLASMADVRWRLTPDVPTLKELGYDTYVTSYLACGAPKGVPKPILKKFRDAFKAEMNNPEFLKIMNNFNMRPGYKTPDEYKKIVAEQYKVYGDFVRKIGLHKDQKKK